MKNIYEEISRFAKQEKEEAEKAVQTEGSQVCIKADSYIAKEIKYQTTLLHQILNRLDEIPILKKEGQQMMYTERITKNGNVERRCVATGTGKEAEQTAEAETVKEAKRPEPAVKIRAEIEVETESLDRAIEKAARLAELLQEVQKIASSLSGKEESNQKGGAAGGNEKIQTDDCEAKHEKSRNRTAF